MRTLHTSLRVSNRDASVTFYTAIGFAVVGNVDGTPLGDLTVLKLPEDEYGTLELISNPRWGEIVPGNGFSHLVVQTDSLNATLASLTAAGLEAGTPESPGGPDGPMVAWVTDPDGYRVELTQWPAGHPAGFTAADFNR